MDNTDWGRNGDFHPTRWESVQEAVRLIFEAKLQANRESTVGLLTMSAAKIDVLATPCADDSRLLSVIQNAKLTGDKIDFVKSVEISQLALKHRPNKNQKQRIIALIYSPLSEEAPALATLAKKAKKNGVAIDIINIGVRENLEKLQAFTENVNSADNSHLVHVDVGVTSVADTIISSAIMAGAAGAGEGMGAPAGVAGVGQVDPNMDPELAEAIRQSLEEQKQMLQKQEVKKEEKKVETPKPAAEKPSPQAPAKQPAQPQPMPEPQAEDPLEGLTEEEIMQRAIMLSMEGKVEEKTEVKQEEPKPTTTTIPVTQDISEQPAAPAQPAKPKVNIEAELLKNKDFLNELLSDLPGMTEEDKKKVLSKMEEKKETKKEEKKKEPMEDIKPKK